MADRPDWATNVEDHLAAAVDALQAALEEMVAHPRSSWIDGSGRKPFLRDHWEWLPGGDPQGAASAAHRHATAALADFRGETRA
jgi:hypothetical protein